MTKRWQNVGKTLIDILLTLEVNVDLVEWIKVSSNWTSLEFNSREFPMASRLSNTGVMGYTRTY